MTGTPVVTPAQRATLDAIILLRLRVDYRDAEAVGPTAGDAILLRAALRLEGRCPACGRDLGGSRSTACPACGGPS